MVLWWLRHRFGEGCAYLWVAHIKVRGWWLKPGEEAKFETGCMWWEAGCLQPPVCALIGGQVSVGVKSQNPQERWQAGEALGVSVQPVLTGTKCRCHQEMKRSKTRSFLELVGSLWELGPLRVTQETRLGWAPSRQGTSPHSVTAAALMTLSSVYHGEAQKESISCSRQVGKFGAWWSHAVSF